MTKEQIANWLINPDNPAGLPLAEAEKRVKELGLEKVYREIELPLIQVLKNMKEVGVRLDVKKLNLLKKEYNQKISLLEKKIYKEAGEKFNLNSPKQLSAIIFNKLRIDSRFRGNDRGSVMADGVRSTRAEKLQELRGKHLIVDLILRYREAFKIKSTYIEPLLRAGERVYTTFDQTGTATGRLSSQNPNLQNLPPIIKQVFIPDDGYRLISFDYSQLQLRILAQLSGDKKMLAAFKEGKDIHSMTASQVFNVPLEKVDQKMRQVAKTLNFGVVYGMGAAAFARTSGLSREEAAKFISEYFSDFQEIKVWQEKIKQFARKNGYVENPNGRKRWLPAINSTYRQLAAEAERAAINTPVQSLEADIIKLAMVKTYNKFKKSDDARLLLSIHDELLFEIRSDKVKEISEDIKEIMEKVYPAEVFYAP